MKKYFLLVIALAFLLPNAGSAIQSDNNFSYHYTTVNGIGVQYVKINLKNPFLRISVALASGFPGTSENWGRMISRYKPTVASVGTFFSKSNLKIVGDIVIDGKLVNFGGMGTVMAISHNNTVTFMDVKWGRVQDWSKYQTVLACGPRLVYHGKKILYPIDQGFSDPSIFRPANRAAVGITKNNGYMIIANIPARILLRDLADIMLRLGCYEAMNLDGGSSAALYYRGKSLAVPRRQLTNLLIAYDLKSISPDYLSNIPDIPETPMDKIDIDLIKAKRFLKVGHRNKAIEPYLRIITLAPTNASYYKTVADLYEKEKNKTEAAKYHVYAGNIYFEKNFLEDAIMQYQEAVKLDSFNLDAWRGIFFTNIEKGDNIAIKTVMDQIAKIPGADSILPQLPPEAHAKGGYYTDQQEKFKIRIPRNWITYHSEKKYAVEMKHRDFPYFTNVAVFRMDKKVNLKDFEQDYTSGTFKRQIKSRFRKVGDIYGYEVTYEEIRSKYPVGLRTLYALSGGHMFVITCWTYDMDKYQTLPDFEEIFKGIQFLK
ncbi:MAG: phosphodiester glycosidase family protein [bacterium]